MFEPRPVHLHPLGAVPLIPTGPDGKPARNADLHRLGSAADTPLPHAVLPAFSVYLVVVQAVWIGAMCQWCVLSDTLMVLAALLCVLRRPGSA